LTAFIRYFFWGLTMHFDNELIQRLRQAERIVFFTGAGVSVESGIPTFRDSSNALWGRF